LSCNGSITSCLRRPLRLSSSTSSARLRVVRLLVALGGAVITDEHRFAAPFDIDQSQVHRRDAIWKKTPPCVNHDGECEQAVLVDKVRLDQLLNETVAAGDDQVTV